MSKKEGDIVNKIKDKLNNNSGVSILFALLLFMIVAMVSVTILSAAYSSVKRTHASKQETQNMLTLDSASLLLKNKFDNVTYTALIDNNNYLDGSIDINDNPFEYEIILISKEILSKNIPSSDQKLFSVEANNLDNVDVSYLIQVTEDNKAYIVIFTLESNDAKTYAKFNIEKSENSKEAKLKWTFFTISGKKY